MTPGARLAAAIGVLDRWNAGEPAERALTSWARGARYAGSGDRAAVRDHVYDILRRKGSCAALGGGEDGRALVLGLVRLSGVAASDLFDGVGHAPAPLTEAERAVAAAPFPDLPAGADTPAWLAQRLVADHGVAAPALMAAMARRAPVYLRVNARKSTIDQAIEGLAENSVEAASVPGCATALEVTGGARKLRGSAAYAGGLIEIQDLSVQRACAAVDWPQTGRIFDFCAGGGGKALAIAAISDAEIFVHDAHPARMADIPARAARAGARLTPLETGGLAAGGPFDLVLCDVPCSGSGTWRRDPEAKWRLTPDRLSQLVDLQAETLDCAAPLVGPGGRLVYMTCSLLQAENADQVAAFQARHAGWRRTAQGVDTPLTASDGFFHAELTRDAPAP